MRRNYRLWAIAIALGTLVAMVAATCIDAYEPHTFEVYHQHEEALRLDEVAPRDIEAASAVNIDVVSFASHLPVVSIDTGGNQIPGASLFASDEHPAARTPGYIDSKTGLPSSGGMYPVTIAADGRATVPAQIDIFARGFEDGSLDVGAHDAGRPCNRLSDEAVLSARAEVHVRGHSSRRFDKHGYALKFTEADRVTGVDLDVLGMGACDNWALNGPFLDKSLIRNYLVLTLASEFMPYVPEVRLCEVFVNGSYQGVYLLMETVKYGPDRVDIEKSDPKMAQTGYILKRDWVDSMGEGAIEDLLSAAWLTSPQSKVEIVYPSPTDITPEQRAWIASDLNAIEKSLYSYDYDTASYGYWRTLDVESFVDYLVINEFAANSDAGRYSTYMYKDVRGRLCMGPIWDFNNAFDNYRDDDLSEAGFMMTQRPLYAMLFRDERFVEHYIARWRELREGPLSDERIESVIDGAVSYLGPAVERNYAVWGYAFDPERLDPDQKLSPDERNPVSYEAAVERLSTYALSRAHWIDRNIENTRQLCHDSAVKQYNH